MDSERCANPLIQRVTGLKHVTVLRCVNAADLKAKPLRIVERPVTSPEAITHSEMASQLSEALGTSITFVDLPEPAMRDALIDLGVTKWQAEGLIEDYAHYRPGEASTLSSAVRDITGDPPRSFAAFARDYRQSFLANTDQHQ